MKIGAVKADIHKHENQYRLINFSDVDCIKGLIKNRSIVDTYMDIETDNNIYHAGVVQPVNQEIIAIFVDLDTLIGKCNLNDKQIAIIKMLMCGWTEEDIATNFKQKLKKIQDILDTVCNKIKKINDYEWKYDFIYLNHLPVKWDHKQCSKCKKWKPRIEEVFTKDERNKDGFQSLCKECDSYRKKWG